MSTPSASEWTKTGQRSPCGGVFLARAFPLSVVAIVVDRSDHPRDNTPESWSDLAVVAKGPGDRETIVLLAEDAPTADGAKSKATRFARRHVHELASPPYDIPSQDPGELAAFVRLAVENRASELPRISAVLSAPGTAAEALELQPETPPCRTCGNRTKGPTWPQRMPYRQR